MIFSDDTRCYSAFFYRPFADEIDWIFAVARPPVTLIVARADEVGWPALVSMTTEAFPTVDALALELEVPKDTNLLFLPVCKTIEVRSIEWNNA